MCEEIMYFCGKNSSWRLTRFRIFIQYLTEPTFISKIKREIRGDISKKEVSPGKSLGIMIHNY